MLRLLNTMFNLPRKLWYDESGAVNPSAMILWFTIVCLGAIPGLIALRDQISQEFGDMSVALESLDQSYSFSVGTLTSEYADTPTALTDPDGAEPACISVNSVAGSPEG